MRTATELFMSTRKPVRTRQLSPAGAALPLRVQCLNGAPLKRFIGRTRQGFDFLGYQLRVGLGFGLPQRACFATLNLLARFMNERATGDASRSLLPEAFA